MPFGPLLYPSIGLSLLKAGLTRNGIHSRIHYFTIDYAEIVGSPFYNGMANGVRPPLQFLAGEWIFSAALFPRDEERDRQYLETNIRRRPAQTARSRRRAPREAAERLLRARSHVDRFLDQCLAKVLRDQPKIVGLTSVFQQHTASLALAQRIKRASPETFVILGGANCEGIMGAETLRQFTFVDATVSGEGDLLFPELVRRVLDGKAIDALPGVRTRTNVDASFEAGHFSNAPTVLEMDELPVPDYDDYFEQFAASRFGRYWQPGLFFETSRGCWWGEKSHCTFCGLNGTTMKFRAKSAGRAMDELLQLTSRHDGANVAVTDNILDLAYFKTFIPELTKLGGRIHLFYETKSNLRKEQVRSLRDAGIAGIQPGIESLSSEVLKLMRKGVSALQNIQLLKWCRELGVEPQWNLLWGFPGESAAAYTRMAALVPLLTHLQPPGFFSTIRLDRFSPNFSDATSLGITNVEPIDAYRYLYDLPADALRNLAYYFSFSYQEPRSVASYAQPLAQALREWQRVAGSSAFFSVDTGDHLILWDLRPIAKRATTVLSGRERLLYLACDAASDARQLATHLTTMTAREVSTADVAAVLAPLVDDGLLIHEDHRYLALAIPLGEYAPARPIVQHFYQLVRGIGEPTHDGIAVQLSNPQPNKTTPRRVLRFPRRPLTAFQFQVDGNRILIH